MFFLFFWVGGGGGEIDLTPEKNTLKKPSPIRVNYKK